MFKFGSDNRSGCQGTRALCLVLALALLVLGLAFAAPRHTHTSLGWYNAECPLAELNARAQIVPVLSTPPSVPTALMADEPLQLTAPSAPAAAVVVAASRAPPLA